MTLIIIGSALIVIAAIAIGHLALRRSRQFDTLVKERTLLVQRDVERLFALAVAREILHQTDAVAIPRSLDALNNWLMAGKITPANFSYMVGCMPRVAIAIARGLRLDLCKLRQLAESGDLTHREIVSGLERFNTMTGLGVRKFS